MRVTDDVDPDREWDVESFVGGHVALDFTNTVGGYTRERVERLATSAGLFGWGVAVGVLDAVEADELAALAADDPPGAAHALQAARAQREALHRWLRAGATGEPGNDEDRSRVADDIIGTLRLARLASTPGLGTAWSISIDDAGLSLPARRVALATNAFLGSDDWHHVALCGRCSWLFLDPSPSRRRRWCSMAMCGNRAKAARHHARSV